MANIYTSSEKDIDRSIRGYMLEIYNYMAGGLFVTGLIAYLTATSEAARNALYVMQGIDIVGMKPLGWVVMFAPLLLVIYLSFGLRSTSLYAAQLGFWAYACLIGLSLSVIFLTFTGESISQTLFITAGTFAGMSLYGYTTKKDLSGLGSFMIMCLIGLIIASVINLFLNSTGLQFGLSIAGITIFIALTAFDTQRLRELYINNAGDREWTEKLAVIGALTLYVDFINIFLNMLNFFGKRRR